MIVGSSQVNIQFAASVSTESLKKFLMGQQNGKSTQDAALALDIVMRQIPSNRFTPVGRSFFPLDGHGSQYLGEGCEAQFGFYQSIRPSQWKAMLVNIDGKKSQSISANQKIKFYVLKVYIYLHKQSFNNKPEKINGENERRFGVVIDIMVSL